jgi:hypothetical protein
LDNCYGRGEFLELLCDSGIGSPGFDEITVKFFSRVPDPERLNKFELSPGLGDRERRMAETYNRNIDLLKDLLFGAEDYAVIARKSKALDNEPP